MRPKEKTEPTSGLGAALRLRRDALGYLTRLAQSPRDVIPIRLGGETLFLLNHPDHIQRVFKDNRRNYVRSRYYDRLRPILGDGLFTLDGPQWRRQRSAAQPSFSGVNLKRMVEEMAAITTSEIRRLEQVVKARQETTATKIALRLTLRITMKSLFGRDLDDDEIKEIFRAFTILLRVSEKKMWAPVPLPVWIPTPTHKRYRDAVLSLERLIGDMIDQRLANPAPPNDLFQAILEAELELDDPRSFRISIRDQVISILVASHETVTSSLVWLIATLSQMPAIRSKVAAEADRILGDESLDFETVQKLTYMKQVFEELLRLYPPAWTMSRRALAEDKFGDTLVPKDGTVITSPYIIHRHRDFWDNPEGFDPERFAPGVERSHPWAYFPFAGGNHVCLGNRFAMLEGVLIGSMLFRVFEFDIVPGQKIEPVPATTLRPSSPVLVRVKARSGSAELRQVA